MKITKRQLKKIIREEFVKQKRGILTEGWWGWNLNDFEPWRDDTLAFIKSSEGKLKQIASVAIKGLKALHQPVGRNDLDVQAHDKLRTNVHTALIKFQKEWDAVNKYESGGDSWWDATGPFTSPLTGIDSKLKPVEQLKWGGNYNEFIELIDALHPDFQKSRLDPSRQFTGTYIKNIRAAIANTDFRKARSICVGGIMQLIKLPKSVYKEVADGLQKFVFDSEVTHDAWASEVTAMQIAMQTDEASATKLMASSKFANELQDIKNDDYDIRSGNTPKGFLPSHRVFAKGVKQGPRN